MKKLFAIIFAIATGSLAFGQASVTRNGLIVQQASLVFTTPVIGVASGTSLSLSGLIASATSTASTSYTSPIFSSNNADPADAGIIRLGNAEVIAWEASPAGTDVTLTVNSAEQFVFSAAILSPTFVTPALGTPASGIGTNLTGIPTAGLLDAAITLAKMADLAQDQFIGRTTASTGVPQTATITAAARTVLDDVTVAAMVDTLGGASASGTGGIVRTTSPSLVTPALGTPASGTMTNVSGFPKADVLEASLFAADAGANDTYVITLAPAITAYTTGAFYLFKANTANTGAATININGLGAKTIVKTQGGITTALADNDIRAGQWVMITCDGTNMQMQSMLGNAPAGSGTISSGTTNTLPKYTAATTVGDSLLSDSGTVLTYSGTGGVSIASGSTAGAFALTQGTTQSAGTTNITIQAPAAVTSYIRTLPGAAATGFYLGTNSAGVVTDTQVASTGSGSVVLGTSPDFTTSVTTASTSFTAWAGATTLLTIGGTGASASMFAPSTLDATSSTTGAIRTSGGISAAKALNVGTTITGGGAFSIGTSNVATVGSIELGAASDTSVTRSAAGVIAVEGNIVSQVNPRITALTSSATPTYNTDTCDVVNITALAAAITSMTSSRTGTLSNFQQVEFRIKDDGTARAITWGADFSSGIATLPTTTTVNKTLYVYCEFDLVTGDLMCQSTGSYP